jgi:uncharacterized protein
VQCPLCRETELEPRFSNGIEVDVCPRCRGLWLDRGELERLMSEADLPLAPSPAAPPRERVDDRQRPRKKSKAKKLADLLDDVLDF